jgi:hypothetical protein
LEVLQKSKKEYQFTKSDGVRKEAVSRFNMGKNESNQFDCLLSCLLPTFSLSRLMLDRMLADEEEASLKLEATILLTLRYLLLYAVKVLYNACQ